MSTGFFYWAVRQEGSHLLDAGKTVFAHIASEIPECAVIKPTLSLLWAFALLETRLLRRTQRKLRVLAEQSCWSTATKIGDQ